jgi:hypothetical protein
VSERDLFGILLGGWFVLGAVVFVSLFFVTAPYGRHARPGWGSRLTARAGWILMEAPAVATMLVMFAVGDRVASPLAIAYLIMWETHYIYRAFVFPWLRGERGRPIPLGVVLFGATFNLVNGYLNGRWIFHFAPQDGISGLSAMRFMLGVALFAAGLAAHVHSDRILMSLRRPGEQGYSIPRGGLFRWVSCPNYLGEIVEWTGWALATWSPAGASFAFWTAANLAPRAWAHHRWYRERFVEYPSNRRALVPYAF